MEKYLVELTCILVILLNSFEKTSGHISDGTTNSYKKLKGKELRVVIGQVRQNNFVPQTNNFYIVIFKRNNKATV